VAKRLILLKKSLLQKSARISRWFSCGKQIAYCL